MPPPRRAPRVTTTVHRSQAEGVVGRAGTLAAPTVLATYYGPSRDEGVPWVTERRCAAGGSVRQGTPGHRERLWVVEGRWLVEWEHDSDSQVSTRSDPSV